jgi:predicted acyl esterase
MRRRPAAFGLALASAVVAAGCVDDAPPPPPGASVPETTGAPTTGATGTTTSPATSVVPATTAAPTTSAAPSTSEAPTTSAAADMEPAGFTLQPGSEQVAVLDADPGTDLELVDSQEDLIATGQVDELGSLLFRDVAAGSYTIRSDTQGTDPFDVAALDDTPPESFYADQRLPAGFGYLETRDGTTLSVNVVLPGPAADGPYPTVVEYSGYDPSNPDQPGFPQLFTALGYAYVGVNMRGSGCSGGSFRYFEDAQLLDGYDAIETIAAQPWVRRHRVGMVGISYPGISQLFVASTRPPSLAAITPLSVIDDSYHGVLYPGGILNTGFSVEWTQERMDETAPEGQQWAADRIAAGDTECEANQSLRLQNPDLVAEIGDNPYYTAELGDPIAPRTFVDQIDVPVFLAGAWQDEQTGGRFATMLDRFTGTDHFYASLVNGLHTESIGSTGIFPRYVEFLDLYVARRVPSLAAARAIAPVLASSLFGTDQVTLPPDRFTGQTYRQARRTFESEPPIQVLFEEGAADGAVPGTPQPRWVESFDSWPVPADAERLYLSADGTLGAEPAGAADASVSYTADPDALPPTFFDEDSGGSVWVYDVTWDWQQPPDGTAASFVSAPLTDDMVVVGSGSADLAIRSDATDTDLEVTITEIRPDGQEVYVQSGWLRVSQRALDETASTELRPVQTHTEADAAPLVAGEWTPVRVELFPFAHAFRAGSRVRLTVDAPGNNRAAWAFETISAGESVDVGTGSGPTGSSVVLPVVSGVDVPATYPTCTLRGQPCRPYPG